MMGGFRAKAAPQKRFRTQTNADSGKAGRSVLRKFMLKIDCPPENL
jgi:hypothetical protein